MTIPAQDPAFDTVPAPLMDGVGVVDDYMKTLRDIQQAIMSTSRQLKPRQVEMVKRHHNGETNIAIGEAVKCTGGTVANNLQKAPAQKLLALLAYYALALDGPSLAQRRNMLWRIATNNEKIAPKTAITAVGELNKMEMNDHAVKTNLGGPQTVNIQINNEQLPRTTLDG